MFPRAAKAFWHMINEHTMSECSAITQVTGNNRYVRGRQVEPEQGWDKKQQTLPRLGIPGESALGHPRSAATLTQKSRKEPEVYNVSMKMYQNFLPTM